jgi:hypothetical protein
MSLFDSLNSLDRDWETRTLEKQSPRAVFLWLLVALFALSANVALMMYRLFRLHHSNGSDFFVCAVLGFLCFRSARLVYRRLGNRTSPEPLEMAILQQSYLHKREWLLLETTINAAAVRRRVDEMYFVLGENENS